MLTELRKIIEPVPYFHAAPIHDSCSNRSGQLIVYQGAVIDRVVVFNDGRVLYRNALLRDFTRERLSTAELADLLKAFAAVGFDGMPSNVPAAKTSDQSTVTLLAARYQNVSIEGREVELAPLVRRMDDLATRATTHTRLVLTAGTKTKIVTLDWPCEQVPLAAFRERKTRKDPAMQERVADEFLARLPQTRPPRGFAADPNRHVYVARDGKLFRVTGDAECRVEDPACRTLASLDVPPECRRRRVLVRGRQVVPVRAGCGERLRPVTLGKTARAAVGRPEGLRYERLPDPVAVAQPFRAA